ncbi:MAG: hypothetical protein HQK78_05880 [Desulfobacterales bacterium]|nr:hypothetical protein [Desulfobacterales bacterium]
MEQTLRYTLNNLGDIFIEKLEKGYEPIKSFMKNRIMLRKKRKVLLQIGERLELLRKNSPELDIFKDEIIMNLMKDMNDIS